MLNTEPEQGSVIHVDFGSDQRCWECGSPFMLTVTPSGALMCGRCKE